MLIQNGSAELHQSIIIAELHPNRFSREVYKEQVERNHETLSLFHLSSCAVPLCKKKRIEACNKTFSWMRLRIYPLAYGRLANAIPWGTSKRAIHKNVAFELCPSAWKAGKDVICCAASLFQFSQEKTTAS